MVGDFKAFLLRTNALALALGVISGTTLSGIVNSLVNDILMSGSSSAGSTSPASRSSGRPPRAAISRPRWRSAMAR